MVQDFFLLVGADVGVDLRGSDGAVSKDMLNVADVHVFLQQLCGEGMAKHMGRQMLGDFQRFLIAAINRRTDCSESGLPSLLMKKKPLVSISF